MEEFYRMNAGYFVVEQRTDLAILWPMLINDPIKKECHWPVGILYGIFNKIWKITISTARKVESGGY